MYNSTILLVNFSELCIHHDSSVLEHFHDFLQMPSSPFGLNPCFLSSLENH